MAPRRRRRARPGRPVDVQRTQARRARTSSARATRAAAPDDGARPRGVCSAGSLQSNRGAGATIVSLEGVSTTTPRHPVDVLAIDEALSRLAVEDPQQARIVELR